MAKELTVLTDQEIIRLGIKLEDSDRFEKLSSRKAYLPFCLGQPNQHHVDRAVKKATKKALCKGTSLIIVSLDSYTTVGSWTSSNYKVDQYRVR